MTSKGLYLKFKEIMEFLVLMEVVLDFDSKESFLINKDEKKQMNMKEKKIKTRMVR